MNFNYTATASRLADPICVETLPGFARRRNAPKCTSRRGFFSYCGVFHPKSVISELPDTDATGAWHGYGFRVHANSNILIII